jgi:hypothetical protein
MEQLQNRPRTWCFRIVEPGGNTLMRLSSDNRAAADRWLTCLQAAGLRLLGTAEQPAAATTTSASTSIHRPSVTGNTAGDGTAGYADRRQQDR